MFLYGAGFSARRRTRNWPRNCGPRGGERRKIYGEDQERIRRAMTDVNNQAAKANQFRDLHRGPKILVLPNAWDVASARILENAGVAAIATTSAGIAFTLGYPDGQKISREEMLAVVGRIAAKVKIPVTADVEAAYGNRPEDAALTARAVIEAG